MLIKAGGREEGEEINGRKCWGGRVERGNRWQEGGWKGREGRLVRLEERGER